MIMNAMSMGMMVTISANPAEKRSSFKGMARTL
jgi:hypothetical protein